MSVARKTNGRTPGSVLADTGSGHESAGARPQAQYSAFARHSARRLAELVHEFYFGADGEQHRAEFEAWKAARA